MVRFPSESETAILELKFNYPQFEKVVKKWMIKHSSSIIDTLGTVVVSVSAAIIGGSLQFISANVLPTITYQGPLYPVVLRGPPIVQARNVAAMMGVLSGVSSIIKDLTDVQNIVVAGFSAGLVSALTSGAKGTNAISNGLLFALLFGGAKKLDEFWSTNQSGACIRKN